MDEFWHPSQSGHCMVLEGYTKKNDALLDLWPKIECLPIKLLILYTYAAVRKKKETTKIY